MNRRHSLPLVPLAAALAVSLSLPSLVHAQGGGFARPHSNTPATPPPDIQPADPANPNAPGPDSKPQDGVPKGEVLKFTFTNSKIFPGSVQDYEVYIPAQYKPDQPACLWVNQDGQQWNAHTVFDNLIAKKEMPVTIGVFIGHGRVKAADGKTALDRFNRSYEYDGLGDNYVRFLLDELLPEVETKKASDGRPINISHNGIDRGIGGSSSGAIAAFTAAWERPDSFTRVFSVIGTYVGLRGGEVYPTLIRKYEPKPLRVFLEDGSNDLNIYGGDWWMANQTMERALIFAGYEVNHTYGTHGHDGREGGALAPDVMRWLWKDWPKPVEVGSSKNGMLRDILMPDKPWGQTPEAPGFSKDRLIVKLHNGTKFTVSGDSKIESEGPGQKKQIVAEGDQKKIGGIVASPDQTLLYVSDAASHWVWSYQIQPDGSLKYGEKYYWLHSPDDSDDAGAGGMCVDTQGRLYIATRLGVQVADQAGRVNVILPLPNNEPVANVSFFGQNRDRLKADVEFRPERTINVPSGTVRPGGFGSGGVVHTGGFGGVFVRTLNATGVNSEDAPIRPNPPGL